MFWNCHKLPQTADKQYIIDQIILYINLKDSIKDYISC